MTAACTKNSGTCATCQGYCEHKPGWFLPGEAERAAELLGMSLPDFSGQYLTADRWHAGILVLSPAIAGQESGTESPGSPRGTCIFYREGRCSIHTAKPFECHEVVCTSPGDRSAHEAAGQAWNTPGNQAQIARLLGCDPVTRAWSGS
jgi:hypothetical protein